MAILFSFAPREHHSQFTLKYKLDIYKSSTTMEMQRMTLLNWVISKMIVLATLKCQKKCRKTIMKLHGTYTFLSPRDTLDKL